MEIERISQRQSDPAITEQAAARRVERPSTDAQPSKTDSDAVRFPADKLEISSHSRELARARHAAETAPDVRSEKVAEIKKRVEDGTYSVSPQLLARKLLEGSDDSI
jgi:negative regulator of flagellin synthesis FlgM